MHTSLVSEYPLAVNDLTGPAHCRTREKWTFILHFHHSDIDKARRGPF